MQNSLETEDLDKKLARKSNSSVRSFEGNLNYVEFFNRETEQFFSNQYLTSEDSSKLSRSKLNANGRMIYPHDTLFEEEPGTVWSANEKEIFFRNLARYSIHSVESIHANLPSKSPLEIINYYRKLKQDLRAIRKANMGKRTKYKVRIADGEPLQCINYKDQIIHNRGSFISYQQIPYAYEMSENFIKIEEHQSGLLAKVERKRTSDENHRFKKYFEEYTLKKRKTDKNTAQGEGNASIDGGKALINFDICSELSRSIYCKNGITPPETQRLSPKVHIKSIVFLEELAKLFLRKVLAEVHDKKIISAWVNQSYSSNAQGEIEFSVSTTDIENAICSIGIHKLNGFHSSTVANVFTDRKSYFNNILQRLCIPSCYDETSIDSEEARLNRATESFENDRKPLKNKIDMSACDPYVNFKHIDNEFMELKEKKRVKTISSLLKSCEDGNDRDESEPYNEIVDEMLFLTESDELDSKEIETSKIYEHGLLVYLTTFKNPDDTDKDNVATNEDEYAGDSTLDNHKDVKCQNSTYQNVRIPRELLKNFGYKFGTNE